MKPCRGTLAHGTGCGACTRCEDEKARLSAVRPISILVNESVLALWAGTVEDPQLREIIRLAGVGLWAERFEDPIVSSLNAMMQGQPRGRISTFERALDALPSRVREIPLTPRQPLVMKPEAT